MHQCIQVISIFSWPKCATLNVPRVFCYQSCRFQASRLLRLSFRGIRLQVSWSIQRFHLRGCSMLWCSPNLRKKIAVKMDNHSLHMPENCSDGMKLHAMELVLLRCVLFSVQFYIFYCTLNNSLGCQCNAGKEPACCWGIWVGVSSDIRFSRIIFQTLDACMIYNQAYFCCIRLYQHYQHIVYVAFYTHVCLSFAILI